MGCHRGCLVGDTWGRQGDKRKGMNGLGGGVKRQSDASFVGAGVGLSWLSPPPWGGGSESIWTTPEEMPTEESMSGSPTHKSFQAKGFGWESCRPNCCKEKGKKNLWLTCWLIHPSKNAIASPPRHLQGGGLISSCGFRNFPFPNDSFAPRCNTALSIIFRLFPFSDTPHTPR